MVYCLYTLTTSPGRSQDLLDVLRSITGPTVFKQGCIQSTIWQNPDQSGMFLLQEEWHTLAELEKHIGSLLYRRLLAAMELCIIKPEVVFIDGNSNYGMEWVEEVRTPYQGTEIG